MKFHKKHLWLFFPWMMTKHIYVHIPFCDSICYYCDFSRQVVQADIKEKWLNQLIQEIQSYDLNSIDTLYFGGGTPSCLSIEQIQRIADCFKPYLNTDYEWTMEVNPDSINLDKLHKYKELGINRISVGVQSLQDSMLKKIGRKHTAQQAIQALHWMKEVGFTNISLDFIYGLPGQNLEDVKQDLEQFLTFDVPHISIYSLQIEENSIFGKQNLMPCDEDLEADMYEWIENTLLENGYEHYEISSYAKYKMYSRHNCSYWDDSDFIGFGCGASGREDGIRYDIDSNLMNYIEKGPTKIEIPTSRDEQSFEAIMMGLRTQFGIDLEQWNLKYHRNFLNEYKDVLEKYKNVLTIDNGRLFCKGHGFEILNSILVDFLD